MEEQQPRGIAVNQAGYPADSRNTAVFAAEITEFSVVDARTGQTVFTGRTGGVMEDRPSGSAVRSGDFSGVKTGTYRIMDGKGAQSADFIIADKPYGALQQGLLKAFYFFRCGQDLTAEFAGPWEHRACHLAEGTVYGQPDKKLDSCGGWHDAGDYGKYAGPGAKAVADLLLAYELYPSAFAAPVPLPESDGKTPDVLLECKVELDWLFKMQDVESGGVYHKLTTLNFPGLDVMPEEDAADLFFSPVSATATGDFAAVMALASRIYAPLDAEYAERCLRAAEAAWGWLEAHPETPGFKNPPEITTGEYGDDTDADERFWAAAELYRTTGAAAYHAAFQRLAGQDFPKYGLGWADMGGYGTLSYLLGGEARSDAKLYAELREGLFAEARLLLARTEANGYPLSLREEDYIWGSNMLVLNNAMLLLAAEALGGDPAFADCALDHLHYLLGRNALDISYVTGFGDRPVRHPHHRPSVGDAVEEPVPGMVSGGPDRGLHDDYVAEHLQNKAAALCFADHDLSYSTNEVTIYWNSPAVFVTARFNR
ncbi:glycoside hydrolase family 9 protein [Paenibacillus sp. NFR01]|uniref:glycoside hydrolase family 9 protein n=1 Tax=Paenibacillus sp. NFR01 TaxID=1566279 RepID=UPI0008D7DFE5|nr:glycoside hydrolase family 9 protein [Paenibacillus sp. NFR01]SET13601.1 non-processive endocellulase [Paenibacillus sp. NFR01]